jgi:uncharacterized protein (DUF952 family)
MNLLGGYTDSNEIGRAIQCNINRYYKGLTDDLMIIPIDNDTMEDDNSYEDNNEI